MKGWQIESIFLPFFQIEGPQVREEIWRQKYNKLLIFIQNSKNTSSIAKVIVLEEKRKRGGAWFVSQTFITTNGQVSVGVSW
jgi:hypothetical protein